MRMGWSSYNPLFLLLPSKARAVLRHMRPERPRRNGARLMAAIRFVNSLTGHDPLSRCRQTVKEPERDSNSIARRLRRRCKDAYGFAVWDVGVLIRSV